MAASDTMSTSLFTRGPESLGPLRRIASGKVRDLYAVDDERLLFVTSDRVSAFDVIMDQGVPNKGRVLTAIAAHWFDATANEVPNHLLSTRVEDVAGLPAEHHDALRGRIMLVRRCEPTSVEWVVRGYLAGSGWKEYRAAGTVCGIPLPTGLECYQALPEPILTPTTKDDVHDAPLTPDEARARCGDAVFEQARATSLELFRRGSAELARHGILLADTKFEFGLRDGRLLLIDEALTPDSSRFWPAAEHRVGVTPRSYDKQILRDHLETLDWDKNPPPPALPEALIERLARRYLELCELLTGRLPEGVEA